MSLLLLSSSFDSYNFIHCISICICCFIKSSNISFKLTANVLLSLLLIFFFFLLALSTSLSSSSSSEDKSLFFDDPPSASNHSILCIRPVKIACNSL
ncbi:hypothetical protein HanIR_Chr10g0464651 [Helianthus annuus]|nr:hypothetical protein HanIR_Chr10g0464651 [Helianthus annuus]